MAQRPNGSWAARFYVRQDGRLRRRVVYARTREEALERMAQAQAAALEVHDFGVIEAIETRVVERVFERLRHLGINSEEDANAQRFPAESA